MFFAIITAYCLLKVGKQQDAIDILNEYKQIKASDTLTAMYQASVLTGLGRYSDATSLLEYILNIFPSKKNLQEELFFSYVREGKLLKQQN
jgi:tetratricopeptide (TPR) repeat protein